MAERQRRIEVFSAGCPVCQEVADQVMQAACPSCEVQVLDMRSPVVQKRAKQLGVRSLPAVAIDGKLADCCSGRGVEIGVLRAAGLGQPIA